mmetsp:Transcript_5432/g.16176  ORF Transcript_5432/g.16176 Transcript_5432/m.16176 type:complete len:204 (-) Transcript_5432:437-1048(-)
MVHVAPHSASYFADILSKLRAAQTAMVSHTRMPTERDNGVFRMGHTMPRAGSRDFFAERTRIHRHNPSRCNRSWQLRGTWIALAVCRISRNAHNYELRPFDMRYRDLYFFAVANCAPLIGDTLYGCELEESLVYTLFNQSTKFNQIFFSWIQERFEHPRLSVEHWWSSGFARGILHRGRMFEPRRLLRFSFFFHTWAWAFSYE